MAMLYGIPWYVFGLRLLAPLGIVKWGMWGILLCIGFDLLDWQFVHFHHESEYAFYQNWDKAMDVYYQLFVVWFVSTWESSWAKSTAYSTWVYRIAGVLFFWFTQSRVMLFLFANIFELFVVWCISLKSFFNENVSLFTLRERIFLLICISLPKVFHEFYQHVLEKQPWEIFNVANQLGLEGKVQEYSNYAIWGGLLYVFPFFIFLWIVRRLHTPL